MSDVVYMLCAAGFFALLAWVQRRCSGMEAGKIKWNTSLHLA
jgi:hypothetical protein